jgi:glycosyltransferase involved in cell wall biosynthesis
VKLLHVLPSASLTSGGTTEFVRQASLQLLRTGHEAEVLTLDDAAQSWVRDFPVPVHAMGPSRGFYGYTPRLTPWLTTHARDYDAVILHGLWQYHSFGAWRALRRLRLPYYVFVHGMLDPWFMRTYPLKHVKKWLYWPWAEYRVLRDARAVLYTCEEERLQARHSFWLYRAQERIIPSGISPPPADSVRLRTLFLAAYPQCRDRRLLLFLGRLHPKKGCDLLIEAFARIASRDSRLHLLMAGPDTASWSARLKLLARALAIADRVTWPGTLPEELKWGAFHAAEVFVLPSHQENFGLSVVEAMGCGLPVLISNKVNIWREIEADRAGLVDADTAAGTTRLLERWLAMPAQAQHEARERARESFHRRFTIESAVNSLLSLMRVAAT